MLAFSFKLTSANTIDGSFSLSEGLSQPFVTSLAQDTNGFIWIGTQNGLNRFNGYEFVHYGVGASYSVNISSNWIRALANDPSGYLWIGTLTGGLNRLDLKTNSVQTFSSRHKAPFFINNDNILSLCLDSFGNIWVGTDGGGINIINPISGSIEIISSQSNNLLKLSDDSVQVIFQDSRKNIWIGTRNGGLNRIDAEHQLCSHLLFSLKDDLNASNNNVWGITEDKAGLIWVATRGGIFIANPETLHFSEFSDYPGVDNKLDASVIRTILFDSNGDFWIGTGGNGLWQYSFSKQNLKNYSKQDNLPASISDNSIVALMEDNSKNLWIGTYSGGLNQINLKNKLFKNINRSRNEFRNDQVWALKEDLNKVLWIGARYGGLYSFDRKADDFKWFSPTNKSVHALEDSVTAITEDQFGRLWIGIDRDGITVMDKGGNIEHRLLSKNDKCLQENTLSHIRTLLADKNGNIWVGTLGSGLIKYEKPKSKTDLHEFVRISKLERELVFSLHEDRFGYIWIGTLSGLHKLDPIALSIKSFYHDEADDNSISNNFVICINEDYKGNIWIGTNNGLNLYNPDSDCFTRHLNDNSSPSRMIYGILPGIKDYLWIISDQAVFRFYPNNGDITRFGKKDGLHELGFNMGAFAKSNEDGSVFLGSNFGIIHFNPKDDIIINDYIPPTVISSIDVSGKSIENLTSLNCPLRISHWKNSFSIEFASLDFTYPKNNVFAYKLEGFDDDWIYSGNKRYASYANIPGGNYLFRVKGTNSDGIWNENGISFPIYITPPLLQRTWFQLLIIMGFIAIAWGIHFKRLATLKLKMERSCLEAELRLKSDFTAMLVHDLRNPLHCISGQVSMYASKATDPAFKACSERVNYLVDRMANLIKDMLELSKIEFSNIKYVFEKTQLSEIIELIVDCAKPLFKINNINLEYKGQKGLPPIELDSTRIAQVIGNLLENAIKNSFPNGTVQVSLEAKLEGDCNWQYVEVINQGPSIPDNLSKDLFNKYFSLEKNNPLNKKNGTGLGLAVAKLIIDAHEGWIGFYNRSDCSGTVFYFALPCK